jgi:ketosteroid isomerase-like protein
MTALDPDIQGPDRVREVFARVHAGDDRVADLYAEDGVVQVAGHEIQGREAIRAFYQRTIDTIHPQPEVQEVLESENLYIAVVHVPTDSGVQNAIDLFELGEDGIRRLVIFSRR